MSNRRYNIASSGKLHAEYALDGKALNMNSIGVKQLLKVAAAATGFTVMLFVPTGCLETTGAATGGTTGGGLCIPLLTC
ncbi:hypothetical protein EGM63_13325 [Mycobacterium avium subsp. paratuberculosis]|nr:hypothetical protein EGM63_13325 [Mycobacterium avium subsp. paratuberculosis]AZB15270.1 hypothetical protein EGM64_19205 [Mycobacterium avium subsp. paratuberculosis]AZB39303.1 hypothetical protein EGM60_16120 [Mycobacterium avium subsp. paratuberculosis]